jgi:5-epi-alpha-selinene synthase
MSDLGVIHSQRSLSTSAPHPPRALELFCPAVLGPASGVNPCAAEVQAASLQWALRIGLLSTDDDASRVARAKIGYLPARVFHDAPAERLQLAADWTTLFCILDDHIDGAVATMGLMEISDLLSRLLAAFHRGAVHDHPIDYAFADLGERLTAIAPARWIRRFSGALDHLFDGFLWEAINYRRRIKPSIDAYVAMREITIGLHPLFLLGEIVERIHLADATREHPALGRLRSLTSRCVAWANDLFTYRTEQERGQVHNLVLLLGDSSRLTLEPAVWRVAELHDADVRSVLGEIAGLPSFGRADDEVRRYVTMLQSWIRGHLDWARDTGRYDPMAMQHRDSRFSADQ